MQIDFNLIVGFNDASEMWLSGYDDESSNWTARGFKDEMLSTWEELRPYYEKLAAYVRMKLRAIPEYSSKIGKFDNLPAHLLGNMWAQVINQLIIIKRT